MAKTVASFRGQTEIVIDWAIAEFSSLEDQVMSDRVVVGTSAWHLEVKPNVRQAPYSSYGFAAEDDSTIGVFINHDFIGSSDHAVYAQITVNLLKTNGDFYPGYSDGDSFSYSNGDGKGTPFTANIRSWGNDSFIKYSDIWGRSPKVFLEDDTLRLHAEIRFQLAKQTVLDRMYPEEPLRKRFRKIMDCETGKDVILVAADKAERSVHRVVLVASSPLFRELFGRNAELSRSGRLDMSDVSAETLDIMLRFVYYDCMEKVKENARTVLAAAVKYHVEDLELACENILVAEIRHDTAADLLLLGHKIKALVLKKAALDYVVKNFKVMVATKQTEKILVNGSLTLANEILEAVALLL